MYSDLPIFRKRILWALLILLSACQTSSVSTTQTVQVADKLTNVHDYKKAATGYENFLKESASQGIYRNYEREADVCRKLAYVYNAMGKHTNALETLDRALKLDREQNKDKLSVIEDQRLIGLTWSYLGDFHKAREFLNLSLEGSEGMEKSSKTERKLSVADTHISLAHVELAMGNYDTAFSHTDHALEIYGQIPQDYQGKMDAWLIRGNIYIAKNHIEEGIKSINRSMEIARENDLNVSRQLQSLSDAHHQRGELEQSLNNRLDALDEAISPNILPQVIWSNLRVGDAYSELGDREKAEEYYERALDLQSAETGDTSALMPSIQLRLGNTSEASGFWQRSGSSLGAGIARLRVGRSKLEQGKAEEAISVLSQAKENFTELGSEEGLANVNLALADALNQSGRSEEALDRIEEAMEQSRQQVTLWQLWYQKGLAHQNLGAKDQAIEAYIRSIKIIEELRGSLSIEEFRSSFFDNKTPVYDRLIRLLMESGHSESIDGKEISGAELAFVYNERARSRTFLDLLGNTKLNPKENADEALLIREQNLKIKIRQLNKQVQRNELGELSAGNILKELEATQEEYQELIQRIKLQNSDYYTMVSIDPPELSKIQSVLKPNTALVEYWVGEEYLEIWVIDFQSVRHKEVPIGRKELQRLIKGARNGIQFRLKEETHKALKELYTHLIQPVEDWTDAYQDLGIVPHGPLHFLPFQALVDGDDQYLIMQKNLFYSPSSAVYYFSRQRAAGKDENILGIALGDYSPGEQAPLPGTEYEVKQIRQFYDNPVLLTREEGKESYFKDNAGSFSTIHLATHGILSEDQPLFSYLLLSPSGQDDGRLTVAEIMDMNLHAGLVTLSACETALGEQDNGDELVGLSRAFLYAGTKAVIVSLWTVDDISTSVIMTKFHQFLNEGNSADVALSMAQRSMLQSDFSLGESRGKPLLWEPEIGARLEGSHDYSGSPYFWAPFILVGAEE